MWKPMHWLYWSCDSYCKTYHSELVPLENCYNMWWWSTLYHSAVDSIRAEAALCLIVDLQSPKDQWRPLICCNMWSPKSQWPVTSTLKFFFWCEKKAKLCVFPKRRLLYKVINMERIPYLDLRKVLLPYLALKIFCFPIWHFVQKLWLIWPSSSFW